MKIKTFVSCICAIVILCIGAGYTASAADIDAISITDLKAQINSLLQENEALKIENQRLAGEVTMWTDKIAKMSATAETVMMQGDNILRCDINGDSLIDAVDASIILQTYALMSTGTDVHSISQVVNYHAVG